MDSGEMGFIDSELVEQLDKKLQLALRSTGVAIWDWDITNDILTWDDTMYRLYGIKREDFAGAYEAWSSTIHPYDKTSIEIAIEKALEGKSEYTAEFRIIRPDGSIRYIRAESETFRNEKGEAFRMIGINRDITEEKIAAVEFKHNPDEVTQISKQELNELRRAKERLELSISTTEVGVWEWDAITDTQYWDDAMYRLYGVNKKDFVHTYQGWIDIIHPEDRAKADEAIQKSLRNECEYHVEFRVVWPDKSIHYIKATSTSYRDENGKVLRMFGVNTDVTDDRLREIQINKQKKLFETLLEVLPVAVRTIDLKTNQTIVYNDAAVRFLGREAMPEDVPVEKLAEAYNACVYGTDTPYPIEKMPLVRAMHGEYSSVDDMELVRPSGKNTLLEIHGAPVFDENGEIWASTVVFMDITERKKAEEALITSRQQFADVFRLSPMACSITELATGAIVDINRSCSTVFGYSREEIIGHTTTEIGLWVKPEDRIGFIEQLKRDNCVKLQEIKLRRKNGEIADILISAEIIDFAGSPCMLAAFLDITERKQIERELHQKSRLLAETEKLGKVGGWEFNIDTGKQIWTSETYAIHEVDHSFEPTVENGIQFYTQESLPVISDAIEKSIETGESFDLKLEIITAKGNRRYVHAIGNSDLENRRIYGFFQDISEQKRTEQALLSAQKQASLYLEMAEVILIAFDTDANITLLNRKGHEVLGYEQGELYGKNFFETCLPSNESEAVFSMYKKIISGEAAPTETYENHIITKTGEKRYIAWHNALLQDDGGNSIGIISSGEDITERVMQDMALKKAREDAERYLDVAQVILVATDRNGIVKLLNRKGCDTFGYSWDEVKGRNWFQICLPQGESDQVLEAYKKIMDGDLEPFIYYENHIITKTGEKRLIAWFNTILRDDDGSIIGTLSSGEDITEKTAAIENLKKSEAQYRMIVDTANEGIWMMDMGKTTFVNSSMAQMLGYSPEEMIGKAPLDFMFPEDHADFLNRKIQREKGIASHYERRFRHRDGHEVWMQASASPVKDSDGIISGSFAMFTDISEKREIERELEKHRFHLEQLVEERTEALDREIEERKALELALSTNEERLQLILKGTNAAPWDWDLITNDIYYPARWWEMIGYEPDAYPVEDPSFIYGLMHPDDPERVAAFFDEVVGSGKNIYEVEFRLRHKDGHYIPVMSRGYIQRDSSGNPIRVSGTNSDLTRQKEFEASLIQAREAAESSNRAKSIFLANMSHELRTPLNAIIGFAQMLDHDPSFNRQQRDNVKIILKSGEHLLDIINDVLDLSKIEAGKVSVEPQEFDLGSLTHELIAMLRTRAESKGIRLILDQSSSFPRFVKTDPSKLRQILINLIGNAIKFTDQGKVILKLSTIALNHGTNRIELSFEISDTGNGILPNDLERIFNPFEQVSQNSYTEGTGLGLAITQEYVRLLGGTISVTSKPGVGSTFYFTIIGESVHSDSMESIVRHSREIIAIENADKCKILIVEDNLENRMLIHQLLAPFGFQLQEVENGRKGIDTVLEWKPDLILMDRRMPVMDGLLASREIRQLDLEPKPVIVAVTAHAYQEEQQEMLDAGCDAFLRKPFDSKELFKIIDRFLPVNIEYAHSDDDEIQGMEVNTSLPADVVLKLIAACESCSPGDVRLLLEPYPEAQAVLKPLLDGFRFNDIVKFICNEKK